MIAELGTNLDDIVGHRDHSDTRRHGYADPQREVDPVHPRNIAAGQNCLPDPQTLIGTQLNPGASSVLGAPVFLLTLGIGPALRLPLILALSARRLCLLALRPLTLTGRLALLVRVSATLGLRLLALLVRALAAGLATFARLLSGFRLGLFGVLVLATLLLAALRLSLLP
jgi:hypothetical protein